MLSLAGTWRRRRRRGGGAQESRVNVRTYVSMEGSLASVNENTALSLHNMFVWLCSTMSPGRKK